MNIHFESLKSLMDIIGDSCVEIVNPECFVEIDNVSSISEGNSSSLTFLDGSAKNKANLLMNASSSVIICDSVMTQIKGKCLIICKHPKLLFAKLVNLFVKLNSIPKIHSAAVIHTDAKIGENVSIGASVNIGKSIIGNNCIIHANVSIYDNVQIGDNVIIDSGAVIGAAGFGFVRDENNIPVSFPQLGGVVIGNNVEIGANACIDRGALSDTIIGDNTKIDNLVHISHNDVIGENNYIMAHCVIAGSVTIGNNCWIAAERIMNKLSIGDNVFVGFGSQVLKNLKSNTTYMGVPAIEDSEYAKLQYKLKKIITK